MKPTHVLFHSLFLFFVQLTASHSAVTFNGQWEGFGGTFVTRPDEYTWISNFTPGKWHMMQVKDKNRITIVPDPTSPKGGAVARFEVRSGDFLGYSGERAEVADMLQWDTAQRKTLHFPVTENSGHEFYAISVKVSPDWVSPGKDKGTGPTWGLYLQLHSPDNFASPPAIALAAENDFHINLCTGDILQGGTLARNKDSVSYAFSNGNLNKGHWVQFVIDVTWALDNTGKLAIYRRDEGQTQFTKVLDMQNIPTLQSKHDTTPVATGHYWKTGFYRSITANLTNIIWLGPVVRGTTFDDVVNAAFTKP